MHRVKSHNGHPWNELADAAAKAGLSVAAGVVGREVRSRGVTVMDARPPHTETGLASRAVFGEAPAFRTGLDPATVADRIVAGILAGERELPPAAFAADDAADDEMALSVQLPSAREIMLEDLFDACDDDGSGALSVAEFAQMFEGKLAAKLGEAEARRGLEGYGDTQEQLEKVRPGTPIARQRLVVRQQRRGRAQ